MAYSDLSELQADIVSELKTELESFGETIPSDAVLALKVKDATREVKQERNYPSNYTDTMILSDMERLFANIKAKAMYKGNLIGAEFQSSSQENGVSRVWIEYERLSNGVIPLSRIS